MGSSKDLRDQADKAITSAIRSYDRAARASLTALDGTLDGTLNSQATLLLGLSEALVKSLEALQALNQRIEKIEAKRK